MSSKKTLVILSLTSVLLVSCVPASQVNTSEPAAPYQEQDQPKQQVESLLLLQEQFVEASQEVRSVVNISTVRTVHASPYGQDLFHDLFSDEFFRRFFDAPQQREYKQSSLGSGVIVDKRGYILTNNHVIEGADEILVKLTDKREFKGKVIGADPKTDIAVIKIDADNLIPVRLGDSDKLRVGEWAIAIGNPFGLTQTVTVGIISAKGRSSVGITDYEDFIQTDAAINPGNSGGALVNVKGELIGINTAIFSRSGGYQGIGFAIPVNMARQVMESLIANGKVERGWLGVYIQDVDERLADSFGLKEAGGALIADVEKSSPADKAGLQRGDIVVIYHGRKISSSAELRNAVAVTPVGTKVPVTVIRDKRKVTLTVTLDKDREKAAANALGLTVRNIVEKEAGKPGFRGVQGVVVSAVTRGGPAEKAGIVPGDVLLELNRTALYTAEQFYEQLRQLRRGEKVLLLLYRNGRTYYFVLETEG